MSVDNKKDAQPSEAEETASTTEQTEDAESSNEVKTSEDARVEGGDDSDPSAEMDFSDGPRPDRVEDLDDEDIDNTASEAQAASDDGDSSDTEQDTSQPATLTDRINAMGEEDEDEEDEEESMTLLQHLDELRVRLKRISFAVIIGCLACYSFAEKLFDYLVMPMVKVMPDQSSFIYTAPHEAFVTYLKVAALAGFFAASPYIFYQIWAFIAPGLYEEERKYIIPIAFFSAACFIGGGAFAYFIVFPFAFEFFMSFNTGNIQAMLKLNEYLSFSMKLIFAFGLVFEMPLFALFLSRLGIVTATMMRKARKFAILFSFILAALLTPPDVVSQLLMAGPLMILYEISIVIAALFGKRRPSEEVDEEDEEAMAES
ncbi:sec-independent protein translocase protein TatC [Halodesulfovibrio marinisediminis DSM 17456]|uniref:Sec-independent protein translocase protein TatC n=1 Tax=Halodesulfovibrio marinisediminis DSM 17456 TaxID=1121457 RepID=A0A1N6ICK3_9BACT|nr:twin-arginine translocase subunit TatC [Halodesulfovibrio marinisediminis]SIO29764.1 sec-independent protein translocase protein TatC [Halodesulfovibrio marinisediminis DSM 17456]